MRLPPLLVIQLNSRDCTSSALEIITVHVTPGCAVGADHARLHHSTICQHYLSMVSWYLNILCIMLLARNMEALFTGWRRTRYRTFQGCIYNSSFHRYRR